MKKTLLLVLCVILTLFSSCNKDNNSNPNNNNNNNNNNNESYFKVIKGDGSGEVKVLPKSPVICGEETSSTDTFYSWRMYFSVGANSMYDRLAIAFKKEPEEGEYTVITKPYYKDLPVGYTGMNITYDAYNYRATSGTVKVIMSNNTKKIIFENILLGPGSSLGLGTGTRLPNNSKLTGTVFFN